MDENGHLNQIYWKHVRIHSNQRTAELHSKPNSLYNYSPTSKYMKVTDIDFTDNKTNPNNNHMKVTDIDCKNNKTNGDKKIK